METRKRTMLKTLSWRFWATIITMCVAYFVSGDIMVGLAVGSGDFLIKIFAYYAHERFWSGIKLGYVPESKEKVEKGAGI